MKTRVPELEARFALRVFREDKDHRTTLTVEVVEDEHVLATDTVFSGSTYDADDIVDGKTFREAADALMRRAVRQVKGTRR